MTICAAYVVFLVQALNVAYPASRHVSPQSRKLACSLLRPMIDPIAPQPNRPMSELDVLQTACRARIIDCVYPDSKIIGSLPRRQPRRLAVFGAFACDPHYRLPFSGLTPPSESPGRRH